MAILIPTGFDLASGSPLDTRTQVLDNTTRDAIDPNVRYEGLFVYVTSINTNYQLQGGILDVNWVEVAGAGGSGVTRAELADDNETININAGYF